MRFDTDMPRAAAGVTIRLWGRRRGGRRCGRGLFGWWAIALLHTKQQGRASTICLV